LSTIRSAPGAPRCLRFIPDLLIAVKLDLNMRRFGQNCDDVLTKRGDQVAQTAAWTGPSVSPRSI
jgi:hypothetical protein